MIKKPPRNIFISLLILLSTFACFHCMVPTPIDCWFQQEVVVINQFKDSLMVAAFVPCDSATGHTHPDYGRYIGEINPCGSTPRIVAPNTEETWVFKAGWSDMNSISGCGSGRFVGTMTVRATYRGNPFQEKYFSVYGCPELNHLVIQRHTILA